MSQTILRLTRYIYRLGKRVHLKGLDYAGRTSMLQNDARWLDAQVAQEQFVRAARQAELLQEVFTEDTKRHQNVLRAIQAEKRALQ